MKNCCSIVRAVQTMIDQAPATREEKERICHFTFFAFIGITIMAIYGFYNAVIGDFLLTAALFSTCSGIFLAWLLTCHLPVCRLVIRISAVLFGGLVLYVFAQGGDNGSKSLWLFTFPLMVLFMLGKKEGLAWSLTLLALALVLLAWPGNGFAVYAYGQQFIIRLATAYLMVTAMGFWFEFFREQSRANQEKDRWRLQTLMEALPAAVSLRDSQGSCLLANRAFYQQHRQDGVEAVRGYQEKETLLPGLVGQQYDDQEVWQIETGGGELFVFHPPLPENNPQQVNKS